VGVGAPLVAGQVLGVVVRVGRAVEITVPEGASGVAAVVAAPGWVEYGTRLVQSGEGLVAGWHVEVHPDDSEAPPGVRVVRADSDGTVYLRPDPASEPFAPAGAVVGAHHTLALVEVMKTFTPVRSPVGGTVERVLVAEAQAVSAGQPLMWLRS
jgi:acetyl-CoA carboxylase biotin carboxyl carrier protein